MSSEMIYLGYPPRFGEDLNDECRAKMGDDILAEHTPHILYLTGL